MSHLQSLRKVEQILDHLPCREITSIQDAQIVCDFVGRCVVHDVRLQVWDLEAVSLTPLSFKGTVSNPFGLNALQKVFSTLGLDSQTTRIKTISESSTFGLVVHQECPLYDSTHRKERLDTIHKNDFLVVLETLSDMTFVQSPTGYIGWVNTSHYKTITQDEWIQLINPESPSTDYLNRQKMLCEKAKEYLGTPYLWGGTTPAGIDCSGLIQNIFKQAGLVLPRDADQQILLGTICALPNVREGLLCGDLVFFSGEYGDISHVGMALNKNEFIHAKGGQGVIITSWNKDVDFTKKFLLGKRVLSDIKV